MINFLRALYLICLKDGAAHFLRQYEAEKQETARKEAQARKYHLDLCLRHQQESRRSHYSEKNCHHCQVLGELKKTQQQLEFKK